MNFKTWAIEKKIKDSDIHFVKLLNNPADLNKLYKVCDEVILLKPSFSEIIKIIETLTELILMGNSEILSPGSINNLEDYKKYLFQIRFPQAAQKDNELKNKMEKLPWPYGSKIKFERRGDRSGVELKVFISNEVDLTKILASLERVKQELSQ